VHHSLHNTNISFNPKKTSKGESNSLANTLEVKRCNRRPSIGFSTIDIPVQGNCAVIDHLIKDTHKGGRPGSANLNFQCNLRQYKPLDSALKQ
jgi:hypothetical protein